MTTPTREEILEKIQQDELFEKTRQKLSHGVTNFDKIVFRLFGKKSVVEDYEFDTGCKITAYSLFGITIIFNIEYFDAKTSSTVGTQHL